MLVYRIENSNGEGVFSSGILCDYDGYLDVDPCDMPHPVTAYSPSHPIYRHCCQDKPGRFAFSSLNALRYWFEEELRDWLDGQGFVCNVYEVSTDWSVMDFATDDVQTVFKFGTVIKTLKLSEV